MNIKERNFFKIKKRKTKERNWKNFKPKTPEEDLQKFINVKNPAKRSLYKSACELQIQAYKKIHKEFPLVRFYDFKNQITKYAKLMYGGGYCFEVEYARPTFLPDGYFIKYDKKTNDLEIFLLEVENHSRVTDERLNTIIWWWLHSIDAEQYCPIYLLEFNRFGGFQRLVLNEGFQGDGLKLLKSYMNDE